jgi:hypothetical protein
MLKTFATLVIAFTTLASLTAHASSDQISFGIDCMIHDSQGKMLSDLGMLGAMMGSYESIGNFQYNNLKVVANLNGPFAEAPEVAAPQLKLSVLDARGNVVASMVTTANPDMNAALLIPTANVYLHCDKMDM